MHFVFDSSQRESVIMVRDPPTVGLYLCADARCCAALPLCSATQWSTKDDVRFPSRAWLFDGTGTADTCVGCLLSAALETNRSTRILSKSASLPATRATRRHAGNLAPMPPVPVSPVNSPTRGYGSPDHHRQHPQQRPQPFAGADSAHGSGLPPRPQSIGTGAGAGQMRGVPSLRMGISSAGAPPRPPDGTFLAGCWYMLWLWLCDASLSQSLQLPFPSMTTLMTTSMTVSTTRRAKACQRH